MDRPNEPAKFGRKIENNQNKQTSFFAILLISFFMLRSLLSDSCMLGKRSLNFSFSSFFKSDGLT